MSSPAVINEEVVRKSVYEVHGSQAGVGVEASFVGGFKIVDDVHECGSFEGVSEEACFGVGRDAASEPIIGDADCRNDLPRAAELQAALPEHGHLPHALHWPHVRIGERKDLRIVQESQLDAVYHSLVHPQLIPTLHSRSDVVGVGDAGGILRQVG
eukprot:CAMPEP_0202977430 /NCGR_PEP_ID=MMETSP1396-20130829/84241_1 /ASSEMBLY_ACC=CAM_ASM_000872 /TAXON_ID= /ORGANISM="Pseudokeronopsis sp., Strain Brazil" /LENGTH=155 /DNA_ID=CAMNT_0049716173 /DNA_START=1453 /DNA_END=1920 /DNA_ORIENTATION=+